MRPGSKSRIYVAGHNGLVGSAIVRALVRKGHDPIITRTRAELDLRDQAAVMDFFEKARIDYVFLAAGKVGGIAANQAAPADYLYENLMIEANVIHAAARTGVSKLMNLGSSCVYPKMAAQPIREESLLTGLLEPTSEHYSVAKIAGLKLREAYRLQYGRHFISALPSNVYGIKDNFDPDHSHVVPGLIRRFHEAKIAGKKNVTIWGSGKAIRDFLFTEDMADALLLLMHEYDESELVNVGTGQDVSIAELANAVKEVVGYTGEIVFDASKPDGTPRKVLDASRIQKLGWKPKHSLRDGLRKTYTWAQEYVFGEKR